MQTATHKNGCYDRAPLEGAAIPVQDGWTYAKRPDGTDSREPVIKRDPHRMTTDCQYSIMTTADPACTGCKWKRTP